MKKQSFYALLLIFPLLSSCYCFHKVKGRSSVRDLTTAKSFSLCHYCPGKGKTTTFNPYYGYPNEDRSDFVRNEEGITETMFKADGQTIGQFGVSMNHWVAPGSFFPFRILGLGADYSYNQLNYQLDEFNYRQTKQRLMGNINLMTFVSKRWIGYATVKGGLLHQKSINKQTSTFDYRIGYGVQFYPDIPVGFSLEGGYGGGGYARAGIVFWPF